MIFRIIMHTKNIHKSNTQEISKKMVLPFESSKKESKIECILGNKQKYKIALILIVKS